MADITLSVSLEKNALSNSIQTEINKAKKQKVEINVVANAKTLKDSIANIKSVKLNIDVNKTSFDSSVKAAINHASEHVKTKLKVDVDANYLKRQLDKALKGAGKSNTGTGTGTGDSGGTGSEETEANRLREVEQQANLTAKAYAELNKVRTALNNIPESSDEAGKLRENQKALTNLVKAYKDGEISAEEYREALAKLKGENAGYIESAKEAGTYANSFSDKLQKFKMHITTVTSIVRAFRMLAMVVKPVVNAVTEVDTALTQLKIVTQENDAAIQSYANNILKVADATAGSVKDLINSTTTFARLGYSLDESTMLAQYTQMLENVGNIDEQSATAAITAIVKAYGVGADELEFVMDKLVDVGNHFPISVKELAEGMNNAGSMLAVATEGNFDQSIALLTAANTTIQNISKSSTGLRTIAARIRNVGTELDDLGETMTKVEYDEIVQALTKNGVALTDQNGELRNTYDILKDLSDIWGTMSSNEQAALAKTLSGTRQQNVFISLMSNFEEASGAMERMASSEGSLAQANSVYLDSIKAHTQQLKNAFVDMSQSMLSSNAAIFFVDLVKWIVQAVATVAKLISALGGLKTALFGVATYLAIWKGEALVASLVGIISKFNSLTEVINAVGAAVKALGTALKSTLSTAAGTAAMAVAALMATVAAAKAVVDKMVASWDALIDAGTEAGDNISKLTELYRKYTDVNSSSDEVADAQHELADALNVSSGAFSGASDSASSYAKSLRDALVAQLEIDLSEQLKGLEAERDKIATSLEHWDIIPKNQRAGNPFGIDTWELDKLAPRLGEFKETLAEIAKSQGTNSKEYEQAFEIYSELNDKLSGYSENIKKYNDNIANITFIKESDSIKRYMSDGIDGFKTLRKELIDTILANEDFMGSEYDAADAVDRFLASASGYERFYDATGKVIDATGRFGEGLVGIAEVAKGTTDALSELDEALKGADYDTGLEKRVEYYDKLLEEIENENWGGKHYKALADYFGIDINQSVEEQIAAVEKLRRYFDDADSGMYSFLTDISEKVPEAIASFNSETGTLKWDSSNLEEFAKYMGITKDALIDLLDAYIQHVPPSEWMALPADEAAAWLDQDNVIKSVSDSLVINRERFDELASAAGKDSEELLDAIMQLEEYSGRNILEINVDTSSIDSIVEGINLFSRSTDDAEVKVAGIASILSSLPAEQVSQVLVELNLPENLESQVISMLPEELQTQVTADTEEADSAIDITTNKLKDLGVEIVDIKNNSTITIRVTDNGDIDNLMGKLNTLSAYASASGVSINTHTYSGGTWRAAKATGTKHASPGPTLLGDEYSASGKPKPELVVSNGRAYLAGISGPVVSNLKAGDIVYTYDETKKILGGNLSNFGSIPAFATGTATRWWNKVSGGSGSLSTSSTYSNYYGTSSSGGGSGSSASSSGDGENWFEQQYELHNHYRKLDQETDQAYLTWLTGAWKQAYAQGIITLKDAHKYEEEAYKLMKDIAADAFKEEYDYHQHLLNMEQETDQEYYSWLEWRYQVAYANNEITLDEYYKYQEEVYKKSKELVKDYFNDIDHKIDMLENANKSDIEIISWDLKGMEYAEQRIAELIKEGKDNNDKNVQEQQKTWWAYYKDRQKREEETTKNAKSAAKELIDYRIKMLKQELSKEKETLNSRLSAIKDFYSKQKELLQDQANEDKYLDEQAEKRKKVSDLEIQLAQLEYDKSAWAQKKKLELAQELYEAQKELDDFEKDHALQVTKDKLDAIQELQEKELNDQIDAIEETSSSEAELYQRALADIQNGGQSLYESMVEYNNQNGTGNPEDIAEMWDDAYTSLKKYREMFGEYYKDIKLAYGHDTSPGVVDISKIDAGENPVEPDLKPKEPEKVVTPTVAPVQQQQQSKPAAKADPVQGQKVRIKSGGKLATNSYASPTLTPASWVIGKDLYVQAVYNDGRAAPYHIGTTSNINDGSGTWVGWVNKWQLEGYALGTKSATPGIHRINENGDEALFKTSDGGTYRLFSGGEHVFSAGATGFLHEFADNPIGVLAQLLDNIRGGVGAEIKNNNMSQNISLGDIYIQGNATEKTISEIRREKRAEMDYMLKELGRLSKQ